MLLIILSADEPIYQKNNIFIFETSEQYVIIDKNYRHHQ